MNYRTFVQENEENPQKLSLWINTKNQLYIEICPDGEPDFYEYQFITLGYEDARMLRDTLDDLVGWMKELQNPVIEVEKKTPKKKQPDANVRQYVNGQLLLNQPAPPQ